MDFERLNKAQSSISDFERASSWWNIRPGFRGKGLLVHFDLVHSDWRRQGVEVLAIRINHRSAVNGGKPKPPFVVAPAVGVSGNALKYFQPQAETVRAGSNRRYAAKGKIIHLAFGNREDSAVGAHPQVGIVVFQDAVDRVIHQPAFLCVRSETPIPVTPDSCLIGPKP